MNNYNDPQDWDDENETNNFNDDDNSSANDWDYLKDAFGDDAETVYWNID